MELISIYNISNYNAFDSLVEYEKYFNWKEKYQVMPASYPICDLCEMLHTNLPKKTYVDIHQWTEDQMICEDFHDLKWFRAE